MPHFENIDQYESAPSRKGRKKIIPIAPHSMQAADYRPVKREGAAAAEREPKPEFEEVQIEPTSVKQMEREFRQAAKRDGHRKPRKRKNRKGMLERLKAFFTGLLGKPAKKQAKGRRRRPRGQRKPAARGQGAPKGESSQQQGGKRGSRNRSRGGRSRNRQGGGQRSGAQQGGGQRSGPKGGQKSGGQKGGGDSQQKPKAAQEGAGSGKSRRRRPRRSGNKPPQQKGPGQNPSANKD